MDEGKALIGVLSCGEHEEERTVWIPGMVRVRDGQVRLSYAERITEEMDEEGATDVVLHAREGLAMMKRSGAYATTMSFCPHERRDSVYRTPYGDLSTAIDTESVHVVVSDEGGKVEISYAISIQNGEASARKIQLDWRWQSA